jgi:DNA-binding NarL/FixJ family response regulator
MEKRIRIFIVSDNRLFREALARIFSKKMDIETVRSRQFGSDATEDILSADPDVLLLDSATFLSSQAAHLVRERTGKQDMKIVMVAMREDEELFLQVVRQGASGYVPKEASAVDVVNAVRSVAQGEAVCPPRLCKLLFDFVALHAEAASRERGKGRVSLTRREEQLIPLISRGLTNKEIAAKLNLSEKTVKNHVHRILRKVGVDNRFSLTAAYQPNIGAPRGDSFGPLPDPS